MEIFKTWKFVKLLSLTQFSYLVLPVVVALLLFLLTSVNFCDLCPVINSFLCFCNSVICCEGKVFVTSFLSVNFCDSSISYQYELLYFSVVLELNECLKANASFGQSCCMPRNALSAQFAVF